MPRASILIVFSESEFLSLMNPNHKLAVESAQAVPGSATWERGILACGLREIYIVKLFRKHFILCSKGCEEYGFKVSAIRQI
jgi:hypothetical protein